MINGRQRRPSEFDSDRFRYENGSRFKADLQDTPSGSKVSYTIEVDIGNSTDVLSDTRLFAKEADAMLWLDHVAALHGFAKYKIERRS